jgi:hypothetical protein
VGGHDDELETGQDGLEPVQEPMFDMPPQPFGRWITNRMAAVAWTAQLLADAVGAGDQPLRAFGTPGLEAPNATELEAMSGLGGRSGTHTGFALPSRLLRSGPETR